VGINNYRNYESQSCALHPLITVFTGLNGAGKTSVLDAIYYLTNGKSYFSHRDLHLFKTDADFFRLFGKLSDSSGVHEITVTSSRKAKKQIKIDDKPIKSIIEYFGRFPSFMIAPKDIQILIESSVERRKVIDKTLSQVDRKYFNHLVVYTKLLKQRNASIKAFRKQGRVDDLLLESINSNMLEPAQYIFERRKEYISSILPFIADLYKELCNNRESLTVSYKSNLLYKTLDVLQKESRQKDMILCKTTEGIHKDDLVIKLNDIEIKKYGSQGQLKSAIIALKLSQIEWVKKNTEKIPILLLDDIFDKLDEQRVDSFISLCANKLGAQILISDTNNERVISTLKKLDYPFLHYIIDDGIINKN